MFSSNSLTSPACLSCTGTEPCVLVRFPGASKDSDIQLRPSTGSSDICVGSMLPLTLDVVVASSGDCADTVINSATADGANCMLRTAVCPTSSSTVRVAAPKPASVAVML